MKKSYLIAFLVAVISVGWIVSGHLMPPKPEQEIETATPGISITNGAAGKKIIDVRVRTVKTETVTDEIVVTGRTQASRHVELKAEIPGLVTEMTAEKGDNVTEGQVITRLEERDRQARVNEAEERLAQRQIEYNASKELEVKGFNSKVRLAQAGADLEAARAALKDAQISLGNIQIKAPFDGIISGQQIEIGDYVAIGDPLFSIVDLDPVEIRGFVTERQVQELTAGGKARARFINGMEREGTLSYIASSSNPQTRTFEIEVSFPNEDHAIIDGMTAEIFIPTKNKKAHRISPSVLSLDDDGRIGVKVVNADNKVEFLPITILSDKTDSMLIGGLPETIRIITVGQDFVIQGQTVRAVDSKGDGLL